MKRLVLVLIISFLVLSAPLYSQDHFGALNTGKYTIGVSAKYNSDFSFGAFLNLLSNKGPFNRGLSYNFQADVKWDEGIAGYGAEVGLGQIYANGNDFTAGFGMGTRFGLRYDHCPMPVEDDNRFPENHKISAKLALYPGQYGLSYSTTLKFEGELAAMYMGEYQGSEKEEEEEESTINVSYEFFNRVGAGIHIDYTSVAAGGGGVHLSTDITNYFYLSEESIAWNTFAFKHNEFNLNKGSYYKQWEENDPTCHDPESNLEVKLGVGYSF